MAGDLRGATAVVTGAGRGIGRAIALALARRGARVALWGRSEGPLREAADAIRAEGGEATPLPCDVASRAEVEGAASRLPSPPRVLVNNAGVSGAEVPCLEITDAEWDRVLGTNLRGPFLCSQVLGRLMRDAGAGGAIVNVASVSALGMDGRLAHYAASKAGLLGLTRNMAVELAEWGVRVNAVSPGYVRTEMTTSYFDPPTLARLDGAFGRVPQRRLVEPVEVAEAVVWLAGPGASAVTGANVVVDGGMTSNLYVLESI